MIRLNNSMLARYGIARRRPQTLRAALFGMSRETLYVAARLLDMANEKGGDIGAVCVDPATRALSEQDGMFTLLVRGEAPDVQPIREERVVQSVITCVDPENEAGRLTALAGRPEIELCFLAPDAGAAQSEWLARFLCARRRAGLPAPTVLLTGDLPEPGAAARLRETVRAMARDCDDSAGFDAWLDGARFSCALYESLCGRLNDAERARAQREMNCRDDFIGWAEPQLRCVIGGGAPEILKMVCADEDYSRAVERKARIYDALVFLCAPTGFLCGLDSFSRVLRDEALRGFTGQTFFDEILPGLPWPREDIASYIISCFSRLEDAANDVPPLDAGHHLLGRFPRSVLPAIRSYARRGFEAPPGLTLALAAAVMLYAGARENEKGEYEVLRGDARYRLRDERDVLESFAGYSHDMPAETLAYAVLADRELWGGDLREIDGLELSLALSLSSIQRTGMRETIRRMGEG